MSTAETRNLLAHEYEPSDDTAVEEGLAGYTPTTASGFTCFESTQERRVPWFSHLSDAFTIRRLRGSTGAWRLIYKLSLLFGCIWLAVWIFWPSGRLPPSELPLAVRSLFLQDVVPLTVLFLK